MLKEKYRTKPSRVVFGGSHFKHSFGGAARDQGATPAGSSVPMHLLLTLDLADPLVPIAPKDAQLSRLPLYYPLRYGSGGGEAQYRVVSDNRIDLYHIVCEEPDDDPYPFMDEFPERPFRLQPFTYAQFRALLMDEQAPEFEASFWDRRRVRSLDRTHLIQFGGRIFPIGGAPLWQCRNPKCAWSHLQSTLHIFARVSDMPAADIAIFDEDGAGVEIYFGLCRKCGSIVTFNRCT